MVIMCLAVFSRSSSSLRICATAAGENNAPPVAASTATVNPLARATLRNWRRSADTTSVDPLAGFSIRDDLFMFVS